jgi:hypothetical protein
VLRFGKGGGEYFANAWSSGWAGAEIVPSIRISFASTFRPYRRSLSSVSCFRAAPSSETTAKKTSRARVAENLGVQLEIRDALSRASHRAGCRRGIRSQLHAVLHELLGARSIHHK